MRCNLVNVVVFFRVGPVGETLDQGKDFMEDIYRCDNHPTTQLREKVRVHSGEDRRETYLGNTTPREPSETSRVFQPIQIIEESLDCTPIFSARLRRFQGRDRKERRGTRELSCSLLRMWDHPRSLHRVQGRHRLQLLRI